MPDSWKCRGRILLAQARNLFLSGLIALLPVIVTIYVVFKLAILLDSVLKRILPAPLEFPGIGILMAIVLVFLIGLWTKLWIGRKFLHMTQSILGRIPLVRAIYGAARDLVGLFSKGGAQQFNQVVMIEPPGLGFKMLGFVTRTDLSDLPPEVSDQGRVAVYLPLAYQMGGFTVLIDKAHIRPVDMPLQSAIKFVITAGVAKEIHDAPGNEQKP
ncbi:MAG: DUF502 domain-containing protein [Candidatus Sumerlaeia bacterium]